MAFNVVFYTYAKKTNSTARPSSGGTTYSCVANEPFDLLNPVIKLKLSSGTPYAYNYMYINDLGSRYYRITDWEHREGLWWAYGRSDPLATYKTMIGNQFLYVYRANSSFDGRIVDNMYPTINRIKQLNIALPKVFSIGGVPYSSMTINTGYFYVNVIGSTGTERYAMYAPSFHAFIKELYSDSFYSSVLTNFGASQYPEAKVAVNPAQYLSDIRWVPAPLALSSGATNAWAFPYGSTVSSIQVGTVTVSPTLQLGSFTAYKMDSIAESVETVIRDSSMAHPQADERGDWLELSPFSSYELFYPPFGLIELDPAAISTHDNINFRLYYDSKAVTVQLEVTVSNTGDTRSKEVVIYRNSSSVGIEVPFSAVMTTGSSWGSLVMAGLPGAMQAAAGAVTGNPMGIISGATGMVDSMIGKAVSGRLPHVSSTGSFGSAAALSGYPALQVTHWYMADDDRTCKGRPLCQVKQLNTLSGYIQADADDLSISCTATELEEIQSAVAEGFFYE